MDTGGEPQRVGKEESRDKGKREKNLSFPEQRERHKGKRAFVRCLLLDMMGE